MIGQFRFAAAPAEDAVAVRMRWKDNAPAGTILLSEATRALIAETDYFLLPSGEELALPIALGYGLTIAMLTKSSLCLTGDETAWQAEWGSLSSTN